MTSERNMSYEPQVGDKVRFLIDTCEEGYSRVWAYAGDEGVVDIVTDDREFRIHITVHRASAEHPKLEEIKDSYIWMRCQGSLKQQRIPHDLMRIECYEPVPTPCSNQVDVDAVMRRCGDKPSCHDVELKVLTVMEMCRELRRYRLEEKERADEERAEGGE